MQEAPTQHYDAILVVSFGGPNGHDDVMPFLENVTRGRGVPHERLLEVAGHYHHFGGRSPINEQNEALIAALRELLDAEGPRLPVYWGNRNWAPFLADTLRQMRDDGVRRAAGFVTSAFSSYSGCRQYREDIVRAQQEVGPLAPVVDKLRVYYNHPGFIEPMADNVRAALEQVPAERRAAAPLLFTAHSVPMFMAETSAYEPQLREACRLVSERVGRADWELVWQSRSGPPTQPWLEPDVLDRLRALHAAQGITDAVLVPIGFISDHMEVLYDLDTEAVQLGEELGVHIVRAATAGVDARFVRMIRDLVRERSGANERTALGQYPANHDVCPENCCPRPARPSGRPVAVAGER